jgi:hypothetical protein
VAGHVAAALPDVGVVDFDVVARRAREAVGGLEAWSSARDTCIEGL